MNNLRPYLAAAVAALGLMACTEQKIPVSPPSNNPHAQLAPVTFAESIAIEQPKEQQFDFYFNPNEKKDQSFLVGVEFWVPSEAHFSYFWDNYYSPWRKGKNVPYFYVTIEHHLTDGTIRTLPLTGIKSFIFEDLLHETFPTPPAKFSVFCSTAEGREEQGREYSGRKCTMTGIDLDETPDYLNGFFRLKIKLAAPLKLDGSMRVKAMISYPTNHK